MRNVLSMALKNVVVLGSTGSIGVNALDVIARFPNHFRVVGLTAFNNLPLFQKQVAKFSPRYVAVGSDGLKKFTKSVKARNLKIYNVESELAAMVMRPDVEIVVIGISGSAALLPFLSAVRAGKVVAPANKEALVMAGDIIMKEAKKSRAKIIPIDSEQSAIFQCLEGQDRRHLKKVYLTASGGPLLNFPKRKFSSLSVEQILRHPRWNMGKRITVDSATLMNKGLEIIEAKHLFGLQLNEIEVLIHPEAIIHSMVSFRDGSILAQLGITDMRLPIQYAITYPERWESCLRELDFFHLKQLTFRKPDFKKFPSLTLAIYAAQQGGTVPCVLNAADEEAVRAFLDQKISFPDIYDVVEKVVQKHSIIKNPNLSEILETDRWARIKANEIISKRFTLKK